MDPASGSSRPAYLAAGEQDQAHQPPPFRASSDAKTLGAGASTDGRLCVCSGVSVGARGAEEPCVFCDERHAELEASRRAKCDQLPHRPPTDAPDDAGGLRDPHSDLPMAPVVRIRADICAP